MIILCAAKEKDPRSQHSDRAVSLYGDPRALRISVDTKKKELAIKNAGLEAGGRRSTCMIFCTPWAVRPMASLMCSNEGAVYLGLSADTPEFAVEAISRWWQDHGHLAYPQATRLLIFGCGRQ